MRVLPAGCWFAASFCPPPVAAQIEEVIVTAQKRAESLQDVPISVQAFTGESLGELGVLSAEEIMLHVPNAGVLPQGGTKTNYFISRRRHRRFSSECGRRPSGCTWTM